MWTAILTVQAGAFLQRMIEAIWPQFITFPNQLPENAGITSAGLLCFMLYWIVQTGESRPLQLERMSLIDIGLSLMPIEKLRILFWVKGVVVPPTFFALFVWAAVVTRGVRPCLHFLGRRGSANWL
jgi:nucleobase:cation symporter-1, NCS1 family